MRTQLHGKLPLPDRVKKLRKANGHSKLLAFIASRDGVTTSAEVQGFFELCGTSPRNSKSAVRLAVEAMPSEVIHFREGKLYLTVRGKHYADEYLHAGTAEDYAEAVRAIEAGDGG